MSKYALAGSRGWRSPIALRSRAGFTLIEVLVVVAIIALLISILLPSLKAAREQAKITVCASNLHQIGISITHYVNESRGELPVVFRSSTAFTTYFMRFDGAHDGAVNLGLLSNRRYVNEPHVFYCPGQDSTKSASLAYDGPDNPWVHASEYAAMTAAEKADVRLRSSYFARLIEVPVANQQIGAGQTYKPLPSGAWWQSDHPMAPVNGSWRQQKYYQKVIYSDFTSVRDWGNQGGIQLGLVSSPHDYRGVNRLFGDASVRWAHMGVIEKIPLKSLPSSHANYNKPRRLDGNDPEPEVLVAYYKDVLDRIP